MDWNLCTCIHFVFKKFDLLFYQPVSAFLVVIKLQNFAECFKMLFFWPVKSWRLKGVPNQTAIVGKPRNTGCLCLASSHVYLINKCISIKAGGRLSMLQRFPQGKSTSHLGFLPTTPPSLQTQSGVKLHRSACEQWGNKPSLVCFIYLIMHFASQTRAYWY